MVYDRGMSGRVLRCPVDGPTVRTDQHAVDLVAEAISADADWILLPVARLDDAFFDLKCGVAGAIVQKFVNYRLGLAIVGDIARHVEASSALRAFVAESNRGTQLWFVDSTDDFEARLASH